MRPTFAAFRLEGRLDVGLAGRVLCEIWRRHEPLRTRIRSQGSRTYLWITRSARPDLPIVNLEDLAASERDANIKQMINEAAAWRPDLTDDRTARVTLIRLNANLHFLLLTAHPVTCDANSTAVFATAFTELYEAFAARRSVVPLKAGPQQQAFLKSYRRWLKSGSAVSDIEYWRDELRATPGHFRDFGDQPSVVPRRLLVHSEKFVIGPSLCKNLRRLADNHHADLETILLTVFRVLLHRYSCGDEVPIAVCCSPQQPERGQGMIGCFVNYVVLTAPTPATLSFAELVQQTVGWRTRVTEHGRLPFERMRLRLGRSRETAFSRK